MLFKEELVALIRVITSWKQHHPLKLADIHAV